MKNILLFLSAIIVFACHDRASESRGEQQGGTPTLKPLSKDSVFALDFRAFRDAVYQDNRARVKSFFRFPVMNANNEIWYVAKADNLDLAPAGDNIIPFTSAHFDEFYDKLFPKEFTQGLLKIKVNDVVKTGEYSHDFEINGTHIIYSMYASLSRQDSLFTLNLGYREKIEPGQDEEPVLSEMNYIYYFHLLEDGHIQFKEIRIAG